MSEAHDEREIRRYIPTESAIKQMFQGNKKYFDEAAKFLAELFNSETALEEGTWFESEEAFLRNGYPDLIDLVDVDGGEDDRFRIAWLAIDGTDIGDDFDFEDYDDEEEGGYIPTEDAIKKIFYGNENYFDEAAKIIAVWYKDRVDVSGDSHFESERDFIKNGFPDLVDLLYEQWDTDKIRIAWLAIDGTDIDDDADEEKDQLVDVMFKLKRRISKIKSKLE